MGAGFVILIHLIGIFILSLIIAVIGGLVTYFVSREKRRRKVFFALIVPFVALYTLYVCGIIGSGIVSENKKIDIGIGDSWYVPLANEYQLLFIDIPEQAFIEKNGQTIVSQVAQIAQNGDKILGKTYDDNYFLYNIKTNKLEEFKSEKELIAANSNNKLQLTDAYDFYLKRRDDIAGNLFIVVGVFSILVSIAVVYLLKLIMLY